MDVLFHKIYTLFWHRGFLHHRCQKCLATCISTSFRCCPCISRYAPYPRQGGAPPPWSAVVNHHRVFLTPLVSSKNLWWLWICNDHLRVQSLHKSIRWMGFFFVKTTHPRDPSERRYFPVLPGLVATTEKKTHIGSEEGIAKTGWGSGSSEACYIMKSF